MWAIGSMLNCGIHTPDFDQYEIGSSQKQDAFIDIHRISTGSRAQRK
jgi:hypothetical protein